jgi:hypothetical protein
MYPLALPLIVWDPTHSVGFRAEAPGCAAGEGLVVSESGPGIFLQGLAVYDLQGVPLSSPNLSPDVVADAFRYSLQHDMPLCAFLGDVCATLKMHPEIEVCSNALQQFAMEVQQASCLTIAILSDLIS